jgi:hypothetical protein
MQLRPRNTALAIISLALYAVSSTWAASATPTLKQENVSLALANELISATLAACHADGRSAVVAVVDRGGNLVAVQRDDSVGPHNT